MVLEFDTVFYRYDHPNGYIFGIGVAPPSEDDGWFTDPEMIGAPPSVTYECSTLAAFDALLKSERSAAQATAQALVTARQQLRASEGHRMVLTAEVARLNGLLSQNSLEGS